MEGSFRAGGPELSCPRSTVSPHELSPLPDRTLKSVVIATPAGEGRHADEKLHEAAYAANKGGTALMTPFADGSWQRAFLIL